MTRWQYSAGYTNEFDELIEVLQSYDLPFMMRFEKGRATMKDEPQINDEVWISSRAKLIAKGIIRQGFHMHNNALFAIIEISEIVYDQPKIQTYRRNWIKIG